MFRRRSDSSTAKGSNSLDRLSDDALTGEYRVWQRVRGHRYSLDDVLTAWEAARLGTTRHVDLGCGIGSVLLMVAYKNPEATAVGIEAQEMSFELAQRNVSRNSLDERVELFRGDLRDPEWVHRIGQFDLVTGTPPYMPPGTSTPSPDPQKRFARVEMRGGVEAYVEAASRLVTDEGRVVVCADARHPERVEGPAAEHGLVVLRRRDAVPREGKGALFTVWTLARDGERRDAEPFVARSAEGERTQAYLDVRSYFDLPPS